MIIDIETDGVRTTHLIDVMYREGVWDEDFASRMSQHHIVKAWITILIPKTPGYQDNYSYYLCENYAGFYIGVEFAMNRYTWIKQSDLITRRITADTCNHILQEVLE